MIALENLTRAKHEQTLFLFPSLITALCKEPGVTRNKKTNVDVTPSVSTNIRRIEAEFVRDEEDKTRKKLIGKTLVDDFEALESGVAKLGPKVGMTFSFLVLVFIFFSYYPW